MYNIHQSNATIHDTKLTKLTCVENSSMSHIVFTSTVSKVQCVAKCRYTPGCVAVALDRNHDQSLQCAMLSHRDFPVSQASCEDSDVTVVVYKMTLDPTTSCHCLYDQRVVTADHSVASHTCDVIGGFLPEADNTERLKVNLKVNL